MQFEHIHPTDFNWQRFRLFRRCLSRSVVPLLAALFAPMAWGAEVAETGDVAALIDQLGDDEFATREDAMKRLEAVGAPALSPLRKAVQTTDDPEIRFRCQLLIKRIAIQAAQKELDQWQGTWQAGDQALVITSDHWWWGPIDRVQPAQFRRNRIKIVDVAQQHVVADLAVDFGHFSGQTCKAIFRLDGDTLHYCGSYKSRPTSFTDGSGYTVHWKRVKK